MVNFDLSSHNCKYLDRHLTFPLIEFLLSKDIYDRNELLRYILDILNKTNMIDYTVNIRKRLNLEDELPEKMEQKRTQVLGKLMELQAEVNP